MERKPGARAVEPGERRALLDWLDDGLRDGRRGRLLAEYPSSLGRFEVGAHRAVFERGRPVAHAMWRVAESRARGRGVPLGMIGLVYTEPAFRGRGLARACIESCVEALRRRGAPLAALWSDRHDFYRRLGFRAAGRETFYAVDSGLCRRARGRSAPLFVPEPAQPGDFGALESLYAAKPVRASRPPGALAALAAAPDTKVVVARRRGRPVAYAALGRGDDFPNVVHEWAGDPDAVLACLESLCGEDRAIGWLCGPIDEDPAPALRRAGARGQQGAFALIRLLDAGELWWLIAPRPSGQILFEQCGDRVALGGSRGRASLAVAEALELLLGAGTLPAPAAGLFTPEERGALSQALPWPLYLWGFDSI